MWRQGLRGSQDPGPFEKLRLSWQLGLVRLLTFPSHQSRLRSTFCFLFREGSFVLVAAGASTGAAFAACPVRGAPGGVQ